MFQIPCKHENPSCLHHALITAFRSFKIGAGIRVAINLIKFLMSFTVKNKTKILDFLKGLVSFEALRLPLAFFACTFCLRITYCQLRKLRNCEDNLNSFLAGIVSGLGMMAFLPRDNWHFILMLMSTRIFDGYYKMMI